MPTYEYECRSCGKSFDAFQSMSDAPLTDCPQCGERVKRRIHGGTGLIFKGSGFYKNDSKKSEGKKPAPDSGEASKPACENCAASPVCESPKKEAV
jgi:putative FmdB family regulatory protein